MISPWWSDGGRWWVYGQSMSSSWRIHGEFTDSPWTVDCGPWCIHCGSMHSRRTVHGQSMVPPCWVPTRTMTWTCAVHETSMDSLWQVYGGPMDRRGSMDGPRTAHDCAVPGPQAIHGRPCWIHGQSMVGPWTVYCASMNSPWWVYGRSVVPPC